MFVKGVDYGVTPQELMEYFSTWRRHFPYQNPHHKAGSAEGVLAVKGVLGVGLPI